MRTSKTNRKTKETNISCEINIDGTGQNEISTGIGFFDHMLEIFSHHSLIDLKLKAEGDIHVDFHHTVEDVAYVLAEAINQAIGEKKGINRYGFFYIPMDESLSRTVIDFSGRPEFVWKVNLGLKKIGEMDTELFHEFFKAFCNESKCNLHIENFYGDNNHHIIESCFKSFSRSIRQALTVDDRIKNIIPSSKGTL
jgi:imidazoleglycerol-phosphate dehydratase